MIINTRKLGFNVETCLKLCRYKKRFDGDYVREDGTHGRFHAKVITNRDIDLHYDLYVEDRHFAPHMPIHIKKEMHRVLNIIASIKKKHDLAKKSKSISN